MTVFGYSPIKKGTTAAGSIPLLVLALVVVGSTGALYSTASAEGTAPAAVAANLGPAKNFVAKGQYREAAVNLEKILKDFPANADGQLILGHAYLKLKDYDKARQHLRLAIRIGKGGPSAQKANLALLTLPKHLQAPKSGPGTRLISSMLGLGRTRGAEAKPTVIDFSASWCQPCKQLDTVLAKAKVAYGDKVSFMTVNVDDPGSQTIMDQYDVSPIPTMVFLSPDGEVVSYAVGYSGDDGGVNAGIKKILTKAN